MDPIFKAAQDREAELQQELENIRNFIRTYRLLALAVKPDSASPTETHGDSPRCAEAPARQELQKAARAEEGIAPAAKPPRADDNPKPAVVVEKAVEVIRAAGKPMSRRDIHGALKRLGCHVKGDDEIRTLGAILWRSGQDHLVQIDGRGYWLKNVEPPEETWRDPPDHEEVRSPEMFAEE